MIKHWEILENKWTQNSAYVLAIEGEDSDSDLILKELSSFCSLTDIKIPNFTHIFELLNVSDDDILQKMRQKIEDLAKQTSAGKNFTSSPVQVSSGALEFSYEGESIDNLLGKPADKIEGVSSSSDGREISLADVSASHLEETKTTKLKEEANTPKVEIPQASPLISEDKKTSEVKENEQKQPQTPVEEKKEEKKEEKMGFFKRLFSFGKKKEKKQEKPSEPLPIETSTQPIENIEVKNESLNKENKKGSVIVKGSAFPMEELGIKEKKEVSLDSKMTLGKEQGESLQAQVPLDDIFAAETICQFYDDKNPSDQPKIEKIVEPTPMPTPRVITITQNRILEENLKQEEQNKQQELNKTEESVLNKTEEISSTSETKPSENIEKTEEKPEEKAEKIDPKEDKAQMPVLKEEISDKAKELSEENNTKTEDIKKSKQIKQMPTISMADVKKTAKSLEEKGASSNKEEATSMPKVEIDKKDLPKETKQAKSEKSNKAGKSKKAKEDKKKETKKETSATAPKAAQKEESKEAAKDPAKETAKKPVKPINMPHIEQTKIDGFDHTIQTTSIPVYKKSNWPIEMPIVPSYTLDNMDMSSNRFAHAAAMSIVENPGTMYNPFFVFGESGCGKTHFLNAIGVEFAKKLSQDKIFITNGVRFSRGVQRAIENGTIDKVKEFLDTAQVLIIDDIHLTAVNETNKEFISKALNDYVAKRKQLVISSKYPPQGLSRFEELINFKLSQGWISELKPLRPNHFLKAYTKMAEDAQVDLTEAQCRGFFGRENLTLGMIAKDIKRAKVLSRRIKDSGSPAISYEQLLNYITAISGEDTSSQIETLDLSSPLSIRRGENTNWGNFGFFFPKESADKFKWIVYATMRRAKELGIKGGFNFALKSAYSTEHIIASAFKIANVCDSKNLKAAIILGPDPKVIQPQIRDNFCDILTHMLEVMMIRCAIISYEDLKRPSSYVKVLGDVLK